MTEASVKYEPYDDHEAEPLHRILFDDCPKQSDDLKRYAWLRLALLPFAIAPPAAPCPNVPIGLDYGRFVDWLANKKGP